MKNRKLFITVLLLMMVAVFCLAGCGGSNESGESADAAPAVNEFGLEDGTYVATFTTDSGMFHVNEANNDKGLLTVENGEMTIHVSLQAKGIVNLFPGTAEALQSPV